MGYGGNNNATESYLGGRDHGFSGSLCAEATFNSYVAPSMFFYVFPMNSPPAKMNSPTSQPYSTVCGQSKPTLTNSLPIAAQ